MATKKHFLYLNLEDSAVNVIGNFQLIKGKVATALLLKMTELMRRLQAKIVNEKLGPHKKSGELANSVRNPRAELIDGKIVGLLDWGGGKAAPYARLQEYGGIKPGYAINPKAGVGAYRGGTMHGRYIPAHGAVIGKKALGPFFSAKAGKEVFASYVFRKTATKGLHFMSDSLKEMTETFEREIYDTLQDIVNRRGK